MSAKWRALQRRHRYTYTAVVFPDWYMESLDTLSHDASSLKFFSELVEFTSLDSIHAQVSGVKKLSSAFGELLSAGLQVDTVSLACRFYLEVLFLENSLPLHRSLISVLSKTRHFQFEISRCFRMLCDEYRVPGGKGKRFSVSRAALSMLSYPKLGFMVETVEECAVSVALDAGFGLRAVIREVNAGARLSPVVMEQCQEALSCLYYLLQRFPSKFIDVEKSDGRSGPSDLNVLRTVISAITSILESSSFSRDCLVAAGVSFCAALQVCLHPQELAGFIIKRFFCQAGHSFIRCNANGLEGFNMENLYKGDLISDVGDISVLSRLCLLRGMLTAIPRSVLNTLFTVSKDGSQNNSVWTILYDGILPELCEYCEISIDSHFNFHALTVTQICLQQIKTSLLANLTDLSGNYVPFPEELVQRLSKIIWNNLEDPLNQTVKQVHLVFDLLLDIQTTLGGAGHKTFLLNTAEHLLKLGARCKGRYVPLASLTKRLGAKTILQMSPNLLFETSNAYIEDDVCCAATSFLKCFLECLRDECWSSEGVERGYITFRSSCLPPILYGLVSGISKLRTNLNTYALPILLEVDVDSIFPMLAFISVGQVGEEKVTKYPELSNACITLTVDQHVAALVSLLKVSRSIALMEGDIDWSQNSLQEEHQCGAENSHVSFVSVKGIDVQIPVKWLTLALTHVEETLRVDAAESLFLNPKTSSLPSPLELSLMKVAVPLNMRCCSTAFQMKWNSLFRKFFLRVRTALERQVKQGSWQPVLLSQIGENGVHIEHEKILVQRASELFQFMKWLSCFLFFSCYPSAPYERKTMAMELILLMVKVWPVIPPSLQDKAGSISPYNEGFMLPDSTLVLVGSIVDSWDKLRESSFRILSHFPTPLPGLFDADAVKELINWAKNLVCSPRVRECDAGALTSRLIFKKYVLDLGWIVGASDNIVCINPNINAGFSKFKSGIPVIEYILSLIDWLRLTVEEGEKDLSGACKNSFVHGALLTLRYTFEELDWDSEVVMSSISEMREALQMLLQLVMRITSLALWVVSADAWYLPDEMDNIGDDDTAPIDAPAEVDLSNDLTDQVGDDSKLVDDAGPADQVVMVGCWLAMKEVSLLLGTIIRKIPLPCSTASDVSDHESLQSEAAVLDMAQLETIGNHFLEVLLKMKHNGAIDKTRAGFTALCNRLLCSNEPKLCKMTESWLEQLMERTVAKGQTVDDLLRRSAGIPAAFIALFLSEPEGTPKKLLPRALRWLIDIASMSLPCLDPNEAYEHSQDWLKNSRNLGGPSEEMEMSARTSKVRDEGVIPTVHAFNVLRAAFNDTNLAVDTSGFCAEALIISIRSFSAPYWEVRNSACLAYTALVRRMIGFLNVHKRESARRALTGLEFFHRYPALHPFMFKELKIATEFLGDEYFHHLEFNIPKVVHPSLCPILILLSRLKPALISGETEDSLDPFLLVPFIRKCATQSNLRVRVLASRSLTGLVSNEKLHSVLQNIASGLPQARDAVSTKHISPNETDKLERESPKFASFNSIHGMLLQLASLLDKNCRNLTDVSKKDQILTDLSQVLLQCSWIGSPGTCPCPTLNGAYLLVLDHIISIAKTCGTIEHVSSTRTLLLELSTNCLYAGASSFEAFFDPTRAELHRQAAASYFSSLCSGLPQGRQEVSVQEIFISASGVTNGAQEETLDMRFVENIKFCIFNSSYEVRLTTLKWLHLYLKSDEFDSSFPANIHTWAVVGLQPTLLLLLTVEQHPKCIYYVLKVIFTWNIVQFQKPRELVSKGTAYIGCMNYESLFNFWNKLISLNRVVTHAKTRETLLCCMGVFMKQFANVLSSLIPDNLNKSETFDHPYECLVCFSSLLQQHSVPSEPVNIRKAVAESIVASGLLKEAMIIGPLASNDCIKFEDQLVGGAGELVSLLNFSDPVSLYACRILDLWNICIKLLEDEDIELRQNLALNIQKFFNSTGSWSDAHTQVERVIELSFDFLSSAFGHWIVYFDCLLKWILDSGSFVRPQSNLVRQVFDKEVDNHHEERLLICQLCCSQLGKLAITKSWGVASFDEGFNKDIVVIFLQNWRSTFLQQVKSFGSNYLTVNKENDWIGGLGNHKDAFISLYANLLGLYCLSQSPFDRYSSSTDHELGKPFISELIELGEVIKPFLRNPLIYNLYLLVVESHVKMLGVSLPPVDSDSSSRWEGFDPYFLLR
ncbi:hypothetical protein H6P81_011236 [Aristolochia fimbriata]|uniref:DUF2428 domain-containing protein n=1 Tax=Aristolochia fimbriata TaxID=158543 RepID=A0AAV7ETV2_ARIFI|nr:hypothetical protein H6P81_011236 [Aristolochia fimbriata]